MSCRDLAADRSHARPLAAEDYGRGGPCTAQQDEGYADYVFGDGKIVDTRGRVHCNASGLAGLDVDVVEADAESTHHRELLRRLEQRAANLRSITDNERSGAVNSGEQIVGSIDELRVVEHIASAEHVTDRGLIHEVVDDDLGHVVSSPSDRGVR